MAEGTGVTQTEDTGARNGRGARGSWFKRNKALVLVGGAGGAILLLAHKGNKSGSANPADTTSQLQSESDALAAEQAALESGAVIPPAAYGPDVTGTAPDTSGTGPEQSPSGGTEGTTTPEGTVTTDPNAGLAPEQPPTATATATVTEPATTSNATARGKGSKTGNKGKAKGKSRTHANPHAHSSGGHGVTVHGRTFPGAVSHHVGPDIRVNDKVTNRITINYGGHTDTHTSVNKGQEWRDHTGGPPSRAKVASPPHPAPRPIPHAEPVRRVARHR